MALLKFLKKASLPELHALEPDHTWYERAYWLTLLAKELKAEVEKLRAENKQLLQLANNGEPLSITQEGFLAMRLELDELHKQKSKLEKHLRRSTQVNRSLLDEVEDLRNGIDRAA